MHASSVGRIRRPTLDFLKRSSWGSSGMRAVVIDQWQDVRALATREVPDPVPGPAEVLVQIRAAGCNFSDTLMVQGRYQVRPALPFVLGGDVAGVVLDAGPDVERWRPGQRVYAACGTGAFAERICVREDLLRGIPAGLDFDHASALPTTYATSYAALVFRAGLRPDDTLLVHAAAGGVGSAAARGCWRRRAGGVRTSYTTRSGERSWIDL
jgi:NADPH2:quinone reductase